MPELTTIQTSAFAPKPNIPKRPTGRKSVAKRTLWIVVLAAVATVGWFGVSAVQSALKIFAAPSDNASPVLKFLGQTVDPNQLQGEGDDRINVLLAGIGGAGHDGPELTDTIEVASIEPSEHKINLISIPRDLQVTVAGSGTMKINAVQAYAEQTKTGNGPVVMKKVVGEVLDMPIHYFVKVDFAGFKQFVDRIGGVSIDVKETINDPLYPSDFSDDYDPFYLPAGTTQMSGATALKFARSRETTSDFSRAGRQQQLMVAIRDKLLSKNTLSNPKELTDLLAILGNHVKTDFSATDIQRLAGILKDIDSSNIATKVLDNSPDSPLMSSNDGAYYLVPKVGNFRELQRDVHEFLPDPYLTKEAATVTLVNATGKPSETTALKLDLTALGYNVVTATASTTAQKESSVVDHTNGKKPFTAKFLGQRFSITPTQSAATGTDQSDITVTVGSSYVGPWVSIKQ